MTDATKVLGLPVVPRRRFGRLLLILLSLVLVVAAAGSALFMVRGADAQLMDVTRTYDLRRDARDLIQALVDAESGQRGYLLTQDAAYLEPYEAAVRTIDSEYAELLEKVGDDPARRLEIGGLEESIAQKRAEMATTIALASSGRLDEAMLVLRSDAGRNLMDRLRSTLRDFIAAEDLRLVERNAAMELSRQLLVMAILVALAGAAILTYLLFTMTQRQLSILSEASTALQSQNEELEAHVRARTVEVEEARAHAERERARVEALLQDTNHRIGNSLATVSSLLGLQVTRTASPEVRAALDEAGRLAAFEDHFITFTRDGSKPVTSGSLRADEFPASVLPNARLAQSMIPTRLPTGPWRAPGSNASTPPWWSVSTRKPKTPARPSRRSPEPAASVSTGRGSGCGRRSSRRSRRGRATTAPPCSGIS